jgi:putative NIF3 family GTP cyclohydrolase 1 type 2
MTDHKMTRRGFGFSTAGLIGSSVWPASAASLAASDVIALIQAETGVPLPANAVDGFKAGDPGMTVKGIATTAMATVDVLKQAAQRGRNLIITMENVYFGQATAAPAGGRAGAGAAARGAQAGPGAVARGGQPGVGGGAPGRGAQGLGPDDPVYKAKKEFIEKNGMAVYRLRDQWTARKDNPLATGLGEALGWSRYQTKGDPTAYEIPSVKLEALVADIRKRLGTRGGVRVIGDRQAAIRKVAVLPGSVSIETAMKRLPEADLLIGGQSQEWDVAEYAYDTAGSGQKKGYIMIGVVVSEDPGMRLCSNWIKTVLKDVPVEWIGTGDPYWRPA